MKRLKALLGFAGEVWWAFKKSPIKVPSLLVIMGVTASLLGFVERFGYEAPPLGVTSAVMALRDALHRILDLAFIPLILLGNALTFLAVCVAAVFMSVEFKFRWFTLYPWVSDLCILSVALNRLFEEAEHITSDVGRTAEPPKMRDDLRVQYAQRMGTFWSVVHRHIECVHYRLKRWSDQGASAVLACARKIPVIGQSPSVERRARRVILLVVSGFLSAVSLWGLIRTAGYLIFVWYCRDIEDHVTQRRLKLFSVFVAHVVGAALTVAAVIGTDEVSALSDRWIAIRPSSQGAP